MNRERILRRKPTFSWLSFITIITTTTIITITTASIRAMDMAEWWSCRDIADTTVTTTTIIIITTHGFYGRDY